MMNSDLLVSLRRTFVPIVVGAVSASIFGPHIAPESLEPVVGGIISGIYYSVFRLVELKFPIFGVLLGAQKQPVYVEPQH